MRQFPACEGLAVRWGVGVQSSRGQSLGTTARTKGCWGQRPGPRAGAWAWAGGETILGAAGHDDEARGWVVVSLSVLNNEELSCSLLRD